MSPESKFLFRKNYAKYEFFRNPLVSCQREQPFLFSPPMCFLTSQDHHFKLKSLEIKVWLSSKITPRTLDTWPASYKSLKYVNMSNKPTRSHIPVFHMRGKTSLLIHFQQFKYSLYMFHLTKQVTCFFHVSLYSTPFDGIFTSTFEHVAQVPYGVNAVNHFILLYKPWTFCTLGKNVHANA